MRCGVPVIAMLALACSTPPDSGAQLAAVESFSSCHQPLEGNPRVLVFTRTTGFRHGSIPAGVQAIRLLGGQLGFTVDHTEDPARFNSEALGTYAAVVFLNTTGDVLDDAGQAAFERYIQEGGGYLGVHSAADTEYDWPWYGTLQGAWFASHPPTQEGTLRVTESGHPATRCLPASWTRVDEWYDFRTRPPAGAAILLEIDEGSYGGARMGEPHPMAWARTIGQGRAFYTALGHTAESYSEAAYLDHLGGGLLWVLGGGER